MSYQPATIPNLKPGEVGYQLTSDPGSGAYVAALWSVSRSINQTLDCRWNIRQVTNEGAPVNDAHGNPIAGIAYEQLAVPDVTASGGINVVQQQLLDTAMGEASAIFDVPDDIRDAIVAASFLEST
jgi:hypothetical protein